MYARLTVVKNLEQNPATYRYRYNCSQHIMLVMYKEIFPNVVGTFFPFWCLFDVIPWIQQKLYVRM